MLKLLPSPTHNTLLQALTQSQTFPKLKPSLDRHTQQSPFRNYLHWSGWGHGFLTFSRYWSFSLSSHRARWVVLQRASLSRARRGGLWAEGSEIEAVFAQPVRFQGFWKNFLRFRLYGYQGVWKSWSQRWSLKSLWVFHKVRASQTRSLFLSKSFEYLHMQ